MALVIVSGLPCSGRTSRSRELLDDFAKRIAAGRDENADSSATSGRPDSAGKLRLVHLTNADANVDRQAFASQSTEKPARAAYLSLVTRNLARDAIVLADGGAGTNIKGFRYQLYCAAREVGVRCVSVLCVARPEVCKDRNEQRLARSAEGGEEAAYEVAVLDELLMRFEEPNPMTRWDSPLFVLDSNPHSSAPNEHSIIENGAALSWEPAPFDAIWDAATSGRVTKAPDVVAPSRGTSSNYLSLLESTTQLVLSALQSVATTGVISDGGGEVILPVALPSTSSSVQIPLMLPAGKGAPSTATTQRLRRQFLKMHASGAAAQNEIGLITGEEGRGPRRSSTTANGNYVDAPGTGGSRAERKNAQFERQEHRKVDARRQQRQQTDGAGSAPAKSPEEVVARRFVAYLEETL